MFDKVNQPEEVAANGAEERPRISEGPRAVEACSQRKQEASFIVAQGGTAMARITIRNLDDDIRTRLRVRAAGNGHSMEEEVRQILRKAVGRAKRSRDLTTIIRSHFGPENGVDLELPDRDPAREPPSFE